MPNQDFNTLFTKETLNRLFPAERADQFFDALYGDAAEGAYDITLAYTGHNAAAGTLSFEFELHERPGKCLACNLTYGLPEVFSRHPLLNVKGVAAELGKLAGREITSWKLGTTNSVSKQLHTVPLVISLA